MWIACNFQEAGLFQEEIEVTHSKGNKTDFTPTKSEGLIFW